VDEFRSGQYLTFRVGRQEFAIEAAPVKGILPAHELVSAERPGEDWLAGEARLRGQVFPVIDLRVKLKLRHGISGRTPCIVVVEYRSPAGIPIAILVGILVDSVSEIIHARAHDFRNGKIRIGRPRQVIQVAELAVPEAAFALS
jgi:purine-binding chemotaxis protein CheW